MKSSSKTDRSPASAHPFEYHTDGWNLGSRHYAWSPPTDIFETETGFVVRIEVAGMHQDDFNIGIEANRLIVSGTRNETTGQKAYRQMEIRFGEFRAVMDLPKGMDLNRAEADYQEGFLTITIPFSKARKIKIKES